MSEINRYLSALNFRPDDTVCVAISGTPWKNQFQSFASLLTPETEQMLAQRNEAGENVYLSMAPFIPGTTERKKEFVAGVRHCWIDADENGPAILERVTADVNSGILPEPALVLETSPNKYQIIWRLQSEEFDIAKQELLNRALQMCYGTDEAVIDTARLLRVAGFRNNKYGDKPLVQILYAGPEGIRRFIDFVIDLPVDIPKTPVSASVDGEKIPYGHHDKELTRIAGKLREAGMEEETMAAALIEICEKRCDSHGPDYREMCEKIAHSICRYPIGKDNTVLVGGVLAGSTQPTSVQAPSNGLVTNPEEIKKLQEKIEADKAAVLSQWRSRFKTVSELEEGEPIMLIKSFLPEGVTFLGSLPSEGKTWLALSISKALTTGKDFLGRSDFAVSAITPVLYLSPESGGRTFKRRCKKMGIPNDEKLFLCQTISEGKMLLGDPHLFEAVRQMKPVVILDTLIRFNEADSENEAMQNKQLVDDVTELRRAGAIAVIPLHHATKAIRSQGLSLETVLRGTGDLAASADCVWGLLRDDSLYQNGAGPNEVEIVCVKPRDLDPPPLPFRVAFSRRIPRTLPLPPGASENLKIGIAPGIMSVIDEIGDLQVCQNTANQERKEAEEKKNTQIVEMITANPTITLEALETEVGIPASTIGKIIKKLGWHKPKGGAKGGNSWVKKPIFGDADLA